MPRLSHLALLVVYASIAPTSVSAHHAGDEMIVMANRFLNTLDDEQRSKAAYDWDSAKRTYWHFVPDFAVKPDDQVEEKGKRFGLSINEMTPQQRLFARGLLSCALSYDGQRRVNTIQALEKVLYDIEKRDLRDVGLYYVSIFGTPAEKGTWSWRFEGHHLSINVTLVDGVPVSVTPSFFGSNPHHVKDGPLKGTRVLGPEEWSARKLVNSLTAEQRAKAVIAEEAPADILTKENRKADEALFTPKQGITYEELNAEQQQMLNRLVRVYTRKYRQEVVDSATAKEPTEPAKGTRFAWAGPLEKGGHYYRVQTDEWLFEYDCTQDGANHVHAVWREFDGDFGADLLAEHYRKFHHETARRD